MPRRPIKKRKSLIFRRYEKAPTVEQPMTPEEPAGPSVSKIKKRTNKPLVYTDDGILIVKTPAAASNWPQDFRLAIVRDYFTPRTLKLPNEFNKRKVDNEFRVMGKHVHVKHVYSELATGQIVILGMHVNDLTTKRTLSLTHPDAPMRILMVYSFLRETKIVGVPELDIADIDT